MLRTASAPKLSYRDFVRFPSDGLRHELIDGEHYVTPAPAIVHQRLVGRLHVAFVRALAESRLGEVFLSPIDVVLSWHDIVEPDLVVVLHDQQEIVTKRNVRGAPALVIEVLSPGTRRRDAGVKLHLFDRAGVREYWMVDPDRTRVVVYRRTENGQLAPAGTFTRDGAESLTSPLVRNLVVDLRALFRDI